MKKKIILLFVVGLVWLGFCSRTVWGQTPSQQVRWTPVIAYDGQVFPSLLLASSEYRKQQTSSIRHCWEAPN